MKTTIVTCVLMLAFFMNAVADDKWSGGVQAGVNFSYPVDATSMRYGFKIGAFGEFRFTSKWFLDASLNLTSKPWMCRESANSGDSYVSNLQNYVINYEATPYSLELPIHIGFKAPISSTTDFNIAVGPYFGVGLFGKGKIKRAHELENGIVEKSVEKISNIYTDDTYGMKRFEVGVDVKAGVEIKNHYLINLGYQYQLNSVDSKFCPVGNAQVFSVSLGYRF